MAVASKPARKKLGPLMIAIEQVSKALGEAKTGSLRTAIRQLEKRKKEYEVLCRFCHVVKDPKKSAKKG